MPGRSQSVVWLPWPMPTLSPRVNGVCPCCPGLSIPWLLAALPYCRLLLLLLLMLLQGVDCLCRRASFAPGAAWAAYPV